MNHRLKTQLPLIVLVLGTIIGIAALNWWFRRLDANIKAGETWPTAEAQIIGSRSLRNDISPGTGKFMIIYTGQLKVRYRVGKNTYEQWHNLGYFSKTESELLDKLEHEKLSGHYIVRYDPKNSADAHLHKLQP
jgi:hypothetical protein